MIKMGLLWLLGAPLLVPTVQVLAEPHGNNAVPNHYDNERRLRKSTNPSIGSFKVRPPILLARVLTSGIDPIFFDHYAMQWNTN